MGLILVTMLYPRTLFLAGNVDIVKEAVITCVSIIYQTDTYCVNLLLILHIIVHTGIPHHVYGFKQESQGNLAELQCSYSLAGRLAILSLCHCLGAMAEYMKYPKKSIMHKVEIITSILILYQEEGPTYPLWPLIVLLYDDVEL